MAEKESGQVLGRDPFEDMEWPPEPQEENGGSDEADTLAMQLSVEEEVLSKRETAGVHEDSLQGKGVWLSYSGDVDLAIEMVCAIGGTHVIYKTGERGMFFVEAARRVYDRVRRAGLTPFAWVPAHCDDPVSEAEVAIKSVRVGYEGVVFDLQESAAGKDVAATALGQRVLAAGLDARQLYYTSLPNIWQHEDIPYQEMNVFCQGGFMPQCYPTFQRTCRTIIDKWAYGEHARWAEQWDSMPPLYPVLAAHKNEQQTDLLSTQEFLEWAQTLAEHDPSFFSIYRTKIIPPELWPILAALGERASAVPPRTVPVEEPPAPAPTPPSAPETAPAAPSPNGPAPSPERREPKKAPATPAPVYHTATLNDTVWSLCDKYGVSRKQFWEWNGHLWDEQDLPRDTIYLQEGWRLRVG